MRGVCPTVAGLALILMAGLTGCSSDDGAEENPEARVLSESRGEHARDGGEHQRGERGEESGRELALEEAYDNVRNGARLQLAYDSQTNSFKGTLENTTSETLRRVRVEVHLSDGTELGPTTPSDLAPGEKKDVELKATSASFDGWTAHPEVGSGEHGHDHGDEHGKADSD